MKIRNLASKKDMSAQVVLQNYMFERFLERLSKSKYQDKFVLKGGMLIAALVGIDTIRDDDAYGGYRVSIIAEYDTIKTPMQIDITKGDAITPKEVLYVFKMIFEEGSFGIWAYSIETVLAEKVETILRRAEPNTRPRDFYDVYILAKTQTFEHSYF